MPINIKEAAAQLVDSVGSFTPNTTRLETLQLAYESILDPSKGDQLPSPLKEYSQRVRAVIQNKETTEEFKTAIKTTVEERISQATRLQLQLGQGKGLRNENIGLFIINQQKKGWLILY